MEQGEKSKIPSRADKEHQDIGVCGGGKHRVINANPLPLTPATALKIYARPRNADQTRRKLTHRFGPGVAVTVTKAEAKNDLSEITPIVDKCGTCYDTAQVQAENETSLASTWTTFADDVSGISDSELTNILEVGYDNSFSANSAKRDDFHFGGTLQPNVAAIEEPSLGFGQDLKKMSKFSADNTKVEKIKATVKPFACRERTIEISPSLMLPVTAMPSNNIAVLSTKEDLAFANSVDRNAHSRSLSASSSKTTLSDLQSLRQFATEETDGLSSYSEQDSIQPCSITSLQAECTGLKESLRLADADIAILVSSKQQLQLELHSENEKVKTLSRMLLEAEEKNDSSVSFVEELRKTILEQEESHKVELEVLNSTLHRFKSELKAVQDSLDAAKTDRDSKKIEIEHLKWDSEESKINLARAQSELANLTHKNVNLESLLREATTKDEGIETFTKHLAQEKQDISRLLQEKVNESTMLQITNKTLEAKISDLQDTKEHLSAKAEKHEALFREADTENVKLTSQLQSTTREKTELNVAVMRLRSDLRKVENSFLRIKRQMIEKSNFAEQESARRTELEERVRSLMLQVAKLNNVNAEMRIRDKNVQIEQLLTKSKTSTLEKTKLEKEVEKLKENIEASERSWVDAVQREKETSRLLEEKVDLIAAKQLDIEQLSRALSKEQRKTEENALLLRDGEKVSGDMKAKLMHAQTLIEQLTQENASVSTMLEELRREHLSEKEKAQFGTRRNEEESTRLKIEMQRLTDEVDSLQKAILSKEEEINLLENRNNTAEARMSDNEQHSIGQLELLSELQTVRRQLSQDKDILMQENNRLRFAADTAEREVRIIEERIEEEREKHEKEMREMREMSRAEKAEHVENMTSLGKKLGDSARVRQQREEELSIINIHNNELLRQMSALEVHNRKLSGDMKQKIMENEEISSRHRTTLKELEVLKHEVKNDASVQLTNRLQEEKKLEESHLAEIDNFLKEREVLRSTVIRQQEYCTSLQKHYQDWAKAATEKMKAEMARIRTVAKENYIYQRSISEQELSMYENQKVFAVNGDGNLQEDMVYTDDHLKISNTLAEDVKESADDVKTHDLVTSGEECAKIRNDVFKSAACDAKLDTLYVDASVQTEHEEKLVNALSATEVSKEMASFIKKKIQLLQENTKQTEVIAVLQSWIQNWALNDSPIVRKFGTQTYRDDVALAPPTDSAIQIALLEDSSTQTDHDSEPVGHKSALEDFENQKTLKQRIEELQRENEKLLEVQQSLCSSNPEITQIGQDSAVIHATVAPSSLCEESWTQTDHDEEKLTSFSQELSRDELERLMQENDKLRGDLTAALNTLQFQQSHLGILPEINHTDSKLVPIHSVAACSYLCEETGTQTDHENEVLPTIRQEFPEDRWEILVQKNAELETDLAAALNAIQCLNASHMLLDSGTQTSHDDMPLVQQTAPVHSRHEVSSSLLEDSSTQTEHNDQFVQGTGILKLSLLNEDLLHSREETEQLNHHLQEQQIRNEMLGARIEELQSSHIKETRDVGFQVSLDADYSSSCIHSTVNLYAAKEPVAISGNENDTESCDLVTALPLGSADVCTVCGKLQSETLHDPHVPSPMTILRTMESEKLKAYKRTVHLLKKKLKAAEEQILNMQAELRILTKQQSTMTVPEITKSDGHSLERTKSLEADMLKAQRSSALLLEKVKRKASADKKILEAKVSNASERMTALTETNKLLRNSVEKLQIKLTEKVRQGDIALKEKNRYQMRARRLQASLRSLAWITGNQDKSLALSEDFSLNDTFSESLNSEALTDVDRESTGDPGDVRNAEKDMRARSSLPASVVEIEASLKDLQIEIIALEKQMQEHNSAVCKTKSQWTRFKRESGDFTDNRTSPQVHSIVSDPIDQISEIV